jgi:outer membrane protein
MPLLALLAIVMASSAVPAVAQEYKIGVFDAERISQETAEGARIQARLDALEQQKRGEIDTLRQEIQQLEEQYLNTAASLSEEKRKELNLNLQRKQVELEGLQKSANQELRYEAELAIQQWQRRVFELVREFGQANGYTLILPVEVVPFHSETIDITEELIARINAQASAGGASGE